MKFSLILCTINRDKEVQEFLSSLVTQDYDNFEVIIVDQNSDARVKNIVNEFNTLDIKYLKSEKGLSRSRNVGLLHVNGDVVAFPDDDCLYPPHLLKDINELFLSNDFHILTGKTIDKKTGVVVAGKNILTSQYLFPTNILGSSTTLFIKKENIEISFDERFGLGAIFHAEEENELIFRLLKLGFKGYYSPDLNYVYHPPSDLDLKDISRVQQRTIGLGAFIAKHLFSKEGLVYFVKYNLLRPPVAIILFTLRFDFVKVRYYLNRWIGIWKGFIKYYKVKYEIAF